MAKNVMDDNYAGLCAHIVAKNVTRPVAYTGSPRLGSEIKQPCWSAVTFEVENDGISYEWIGVTLVRVTLAVLCDSKHWCIGERWKFSNARIALMPGELISPQRYVMIYDEAEPIPNEERNDAEST